MGGQVMVFAPAPQLTVTLERFHNPAAGNAADHDELHLHAGGQGVWQARMIASLGVPVTLCAVLGGEVGRVLEPLIAAEGVTIRAVFRAAGNGWYVHDRRSGERKTLAEQPGAPLGRHELDELYDVALGEGLKATVSVLSGPASAEVVTPDAYRRLAVDLTTNGRRLVADLSGAHLEAVLAGEPYLVKVSHEELDSDPDDVSRLADQIWRLREAGAQTVVVSRAERPALALLDDDEIVEVQMPPLQVADQRGAGDTMTAVMVSMLARGEPMRDAVRAGAAAGALNVTQHGLGTGRAEAIGELTQRVEIQPLGGR